MFNDQKVERKEITIWCYVDIEDLGKYISQLEGVERNGRKHRSVF